MSLASWADCPEPVRSQVTGLVESVQALLGSALVGVYLHGSLAYGCFHPAHSDLDLLVLTARPLPRDAKLGLVKTLLRRSTTPAPVELSVVSRSDLNPWQYPPPYQLHYSEAWRERLTVDVTTLAWLGWPSGQQGTDPDLAAHLTVARARGIALVGPPPAEVLAEVPAADYLAAIIQDSEAALTRPLASPVATILNLCRVAWYLRAQVLSSKEEAGVWAQDTVRPPHRELVSQALAVYRGTVAERTWEGDTIRRFGHQVLGAAALSAERQLQLGDR